MWNKEEFRPVSSSIIFVIAAPSGGGKSSLVNALVESMDGLGTSVSHTTRNRRPAEEDGQNYHFVDEDTFFAMRDSDEFIETARVFDAAWYGTSKKAIGMAIADGKDVLLDIDWQGAQVIKALFPAKVETIFLLPPSKEALLQRLRSRNREDEAQIQARMAEAKAEASHCHEFDYLIINDDFDDALRQLSSVIISARCRYRRQATHYQTFINQMLPKE